MPLINRFRSRLAWSLPCLGLSLIVLLFVAPLRADDAKTLVIEPQSGAYAGKQFYTNSHALLIGVREYQHLPKEKWLHYADRDAIDLREVLIRNYGFPAANVTLLLNEQATKANIEDALATLTDDAIGHDDRVLIFFSGHGRR